VHFDPLPDGAGNHYPVVYTNYTVPEGVKVLQRRPDTSSVLRQRRHTMSTSLKFLRNRSGAASGHSDKYILELKEYYKQFIYLYTYDKYGNAQTHTDDHFEIKIHESCPYRLRSMTRGKEVSDVKITKNVYKCEFVITEEFERKLFAKGFSSLVDSTEVIECILEIKCNGIELPNSPFILRTNIDGSSKERKKYTNIDTSSVLEDAHNTRSLQEYQHMARKRSRKNKMMRYASTNSYHDTSEEEEEDDDDDLLYNQQASNEKSMVNQAIASKYTQHNFNALANGSPSYRNTHNSRIPNRTKFIPLRSDDYISPSPESLKDALYPTLSEYIRGDVYERLKTSVFSSLNLMQPNVQLPMAEPTMRVLEANVPSLWIVFLEYRYKLKKHQANVQLKTSESWNVPDAFAGWSMYRNTLIKLKHYMHRNQLQELLLDFDVIPSLINKRQMNDVVSIVLSHNAKNLQIQNTEATRSLHDRKTNLAAQRIEFPEFVEIIVRVALLAFDNNGYNRLYSHQEMKLNAFMKLWGFGNVSKLRAVLANKVREKSSNWFHKPVS